MSLSVWRIAADTPRFEAHDLSGLGAQLHGGRWNRPGRPVVYAASSVALACLETLIHLNAAGLPLNRYLVRIDIPDALWAARRELKGPPTGWDAIPEGRVSLDLGDAWLRAADSAVLVVPSVVVPEEMNVLLNPLHADARLLSANKLRAWRYDGRLV